MVFFYSCLSCVCPIQLNPSGNTLADTSNIGLYYAWVFLNLIKLMLAIKIDITVAKVIQVVDL